MKALQSLTLSILLTLAGPGTLLAADAPAGEETPAKDSRSAAFVYANKVLKRRLQSDHRLGAEPDNEIGKAVVYGSLPFEDSELHLIAGHYQSMGTLDAPEEEPIRPPKGQDPNIAATRRAAELMVEGHANEVVLDELGAPPWADGEGGILGKVRPEAAWLAESFDLAMGGYINKATSKLQDNWKVLGKNSRAINNLACLKALDGDSEGALKLVAQSSESAITALNRGHLELACGHLEAALTIFKNLKESSAFAPGKLKIELLCSLAKAQYLHKDKESGATVAELLKLYPNNTRALLLAADLALLEKDYATAVHHLEAIGNQSGPEALIKLSQCYSRQGKFDQALKLGNTAARSYPESVAAHMNLAKLYQDDKEWLGARLQYERALELDPPLAVKKTIFSALINIFEVTHEQKELLKRTSAWLKEYPNESAIHANRAYALSLDESKGARQEAVKEYEQALKLPGANKNIRYNLALLLSQLGQKDQARVQAKIYMNEAAPRGKAQAEALLHSLDN
jgi:tetratricopeptide (TPR) repeat protein